MPDENRFGNLSDALKKRKDAAKQPDSQTAKQLPTGKAKSKSSDHTKLTVYITKALHKRLKIGAAELEMELSDIAEEAISEYLDKRLNV